jgi:hypothetical protein
MTLIEYCKRNDILINRNAKTGATNITTPLWEVPSDVPAPARYPQLRELWRLSDYAVSTVSGPTVWLVPRS